MRTKYFDVNENGCSIRCKLYCDDPREVRRAIVFCHGFGGHKDNKAAETFATRAVSKRKGTAVIAFDWPCHGADARKNLLVEDCDTYLATLIEHVRAQYACDELYAYGTSFGGYLLLRYLADHGNPFRKVALRCPAINMLDTLLGAIATDDDRAALAAGKPVLVGFDRKVKISPAFVDALRTVNLYEVPFIDYADDMLIIHGTRDEIVPMEHSARFADNNVIEFVPVDRADHRFRDPKKMDVAIACIISFFGL